MTSPRKGLTTPGAVLLVIFAGIVAVGLWALGGREPDRENGSGADVFTVRRGSFEVVIPATGELAAQNQTEILNKLEQRAAITEVAEEGTIVKAGDVLVKFNDEEIRTRLNEAEEGVIGSQNELESAQADLEIRKKTQESEVEKAQLKVEIAELDLNGWEKGTVVSMRQKLQLAQEKAEMNFNRLDDRFDASKRLLEKKFISLDEFKQEEIALLEARAQLKQTSLDIEVYEQFTIVKERKQKVSDLEQSRKELLRVIARQQAEVDRAESNVFGRQRRLDGRQERLEHFLEQLEYCSIIAEQDGLVVYASSLEQFRWMGMNGMNIQVGTELHHNQMVMILPDTSRMIAEVKVNEALTGLIEPGQPVTLTCDAAPDDVLTGVVEGIGVLAEAGGGWVDRNRRDYTVRILLDGNNALALKPSMRCQADIRIDQVVDALNVPIQAIHREGAQIFVYVPDGAGYAQRRVTVGRASELYIEVTEGLTGGERVLLREPDAEEITSLLPPAPEPTAEVEEEVAEAPAPDDPAIAVPPGMTPTANAEAPTDDRPEGVNPEEAPDGTGPPTNGKE